MPVLDENKELAATLSLNSLKGVEDLVNIVKTKTVAEFTDSVIVEKYRSPTVKENITFGDALALFAERRAHRAWVSDADGKIIGVVTCSDMTKALLKILS